MCMCESILGLEQLTAVVQSKRGAKKPKRHKNLCSGALGLWKCMCKSMIGLKKYCSCPIKERCKETQAP